MRFDMKKILVAASLASMITACKSPQEITSTDDVYVNPVEERRLAKIAAEQQARDEALARQAQAQAQEVQEQKPATPDRYYKDPDYNSDDYYDYEYASRINRFSRPLYGAGYYDPYYTNLYTYNQNPAFYGTSIYSSSMMMPSAQFSGLSFGISSGWGTGYNSYGYGGYYPYGYNAYGYNGYSPYGYGYTGYYPWYTGYYAPWGYSSFGYGGGFYNGYNMGYYNGINAGHWGYFNSLDPNSGYGKMEYGPRGTSTGGNSPSRTYPGMQRPLNENREKYFDNVVQQQNQSPRFSASDGRGVGTRVGNRAQKPAGGGGNGIEAPQTERVYNGRSAGGSGNTRVRRTDNNSGRQERQGVDNNSNGNWNAAPRQGGSSPRGGSSSPRNSGGNSRPR
jgi:hypothetical protein